MNRKLAPLILASLVLITGCSTLSGGNEDETTIEECDLKHEITHDLNATAEPRASYDYESLSEGAKGVVERALNSTDQTYTVPNNSMESPDEFAYPDEVAYYEIQKEGDVFLLVTWTSEGCVV